MKKIFGTIALFVFILLFSWTNVVFSQVSVTEKNTTIPTYEVKEADPNPIFYNGRRYQGAQGRVYPYPQLHDLTDQKKGKDYTEVILENEHVEISILPEVGGRIYYARDKKNDYNYIYHNEVIKPALIGMTGAWISGGVEWNIPHHHRATSFTPVDYTITENEDGSKTVWVGETEWRHRSRWIVGVTLKPDSTLLETTIRVFNTTPFQNSTLMFANAAVHANENYQVIFPPKTQWATYHRKNQFSQWPVSYQEYDGEDYTEGVDVSWWKNHSKSTSFFEWGNKGNFVAGIDHGEEAGTVIFGNKHINPGKKLWSWGNNPNGKKWDNLLTDENGPYIELMFGSYSDNQPDYSWMQTRETKETTYSFAPLKGLENVKKVNENAAINFEKEDDKISFGINAHHDLENSTIQITAGEKILHNIQADLHPNTPFNNKGEYPDDYEIYDLTLSLKDSRGNTLISYSPEKVEKEPKPEPVSPTQGVSNIQNPDSLYYQGLYYEQFHDAYYQPRDFYKKAIELNPQHVPALVRTGLLYLKEGDYDGAIEYLESAVDRVTWDYVTPERGEALYYLSLAYDELGREKEAYKLLYKTSWDYDFRSAAHFKMAQMKSRDADYTRALNHLEVAYKTNTQGVDILGLQASLYRRTGKSDKAEQVVEQLIDIDPLNFRGYHEKYLLTGDEEEREHLKELMRNSEENHLELAVEYGNAGLYKEATELLEYSISLGDEELKDSPVIHYYLGYYNHQLNNTSEAKKYFQAAGEKPHKFVFPFRFETVDALKTALGYNPEDGLAWYYIGNIYYDHQPEKAIEAWENAVDRNDDIPVAHRNLAFASANVENDYEATMQHIRRAIELNPDDPRYFSEQDKYLKSIQATPEERIKPFINNKEVVTSELTSLSPYVKLLTLTERYDEAIDLMKNHHFRRWEGGGGVYPSWIYAHLNKATFALEENQLDKAKKILAASISYPENLQTVSSQFENIAYYFKGVVAEESGNENKAATFFEKATNGSDQEPECAFYAAKAYEKSGNPEKATSVYQGLIDSGKKGLEQDDAVDFFDPFSAVQSSNEVKAENNFKIALGYLGLNKVDQAYEYFDRALDANPALLSLAFQTNS